MTPNLKQLAELIGAKAQFESFELTKLPLPAGFSVSPVARGYLSAVPKTNWEVGYYHLLCSEEIIDQTLNYIPGIPLRPFWAHHHRARLIRKLRLA
jgi:hypothetical protein